MLIKTKFSGYAADGIRVMPFGGGDGGGGNNYYANMDALYGQQTRIAGGVYDSIFAPYAPGVVSDLNAMRGEDLAGKARGQASADAGQAMGQSIEAVNRNMARYGLNPHEFASDSNAVALGGAAMKADSMNKANQWANQQKWGRSFDFYNSLAGIPTQSASSLGQAASGYGAAGNAARQSNAQSSAGLGMGLAYMMKADGGYIDKDELHAADGTYVQPVKRGLSRNLWLPAAGSANLSSSGGGSSGGLDANTAILLGVLALKNEDKVAKYFGKVKDAFAPTEASAGSGGVQAEASTLPEQTSAADMAGTEQLMSAFNDTAAWNTAMGAGAEGAADWSSAADQSWLADSSWFRDGGEVRLAGGGMVPRMGLRMAVTNQGTIPEMGKVAFSAPQQGPSPKDIAMAAAAQPAPDPDGFGSKSADNRHAGGKAVMSVYGGMLGGRAGSMFGGALADVLHPVMEKVTRTAIMTGDKIGRELMPGEKYDDAAGFLGASVFDPVGAILSGKYFAGGGLARKDMTHGGDVQGPGTATSDSIPARLSDGEYVLNAESVKMVGKENLDEINNAGLKVRYAKGLNLSRGGQVKKGCANV